MFKKLLCAVALLCAYAGAQQINPNTQIKWGAITNTGACHFGLTLDASGNISLGGCNGVSLQTNGTLNIDPSLLNLQDSTNCSWTNPSGGNEQVNCNLGGSLQTFLPDPLGTQSVVVPFTVATNNDNGGGDCFVVSDTISGTVTIDGGSNLGCQAPPGASITWSAAVLPGYVTPANVTAVYAVGTVGYTGSSQHMNVTCSGFTLMNGDTISGSPDSGVLKPYNVVLTGTTGSNIGTVTCVANVAANAGGATNPAVMNIASLALRVYYTGTAPPASTILNVTPCLYVNKALNTLGAAAVNLSGTGDCGVTGTLPMTSLTAPASTTVTGTTAGTAVWTQPFQFTTWKFVTVYLNAYENTTATAQTITLPASFATVGYVVTDGGTCTGVTISGTTVTLPASMGATQTGLCEIRGY